MSSIATETFPALWQPTEQVETIEISDRAARSVEAGNLWVFSNEIIRKPGGLKMGAWCWFKCREKFIGTGYFNPHSLIAGRIVTFDETRDISQAVSARLHQSFMRRMPLSINESARLVFSEADFLPGLVLDYFSGVLVLQSNTAGIDAILPELESLVPAVFEKVFSKKAAGFVVRADSGIRRLENRPDFTKVVMGSEAGLKESSFLADGITYAADFVGGQKTGHFLDQRDNRRALAEVVKKMTKPRVLDLFCYSGGWGLTALKAGAAHVTFVDESPKAIELVEKGFVQNKISKDLGKFIESDAFDFLEKDTESYDIIVADPPAFVKSKKNLPQAVRAYEKLNRWAWRRLKPGGLLFSCSCSYHLSDSDFIDVLRTAIGKEKGNAHVVYRGGQASDHPVLLAMPETRYLKCIGLQKMEPAAKPS